MLNEKGVRDQLAEIRAAKEKLESQRIALERIENSLRHWLQVNTGESEQRVAATPSSTTAKSVSKRTPGSIPLADAMIRVLADKHGNAMKVPEILAAALSMGARTNSKNPHKHAEWILYSLMREHPIKRVGKGTWIYPF
jgi:hypothetical protein